MTQTVATTSGRHAGALLASGAADGSVYVWERVVNILDIH